MPGSARVTSPSGFFVVASNVTLVVLNLIRASLEELAIALEEL